VPQALRDPYPHLDLSLLLQEERKGGAGYVASEPPCAGGRCTFWHWPAAALARPVELSKHLLQTRLHSFGGAHGSTCAHRSC
jgi:hypothetical protein